jgi:tyrosyl-tRNA synthetase
MANKVYSYYKELPSWAKGVVVIGILGATYIFASQTIKKIKEQAKSKKLQQGVQDATNELNDLAQQGVRPTITQSQADGFADKIVKQFKGADLLLESYPTVLNIFKSLKNNADFLLLKKQFGLRTYDDAFWGSVKDVTLEGAIQDELTTMRIASLNSQLKKQGITYQV